MNNEMWRELRVETRQDVEAVLDAMYHKCQTLARQEPDINSDAAQQLRTLAGRIRVTLDRSPEMSAFLTEQGHKAASFPTAPDEMHVSAVRFSDGKAFVCGPPSTGKEE